MIEFLEWLISDESHAGAFFVVLFGIGFTLEWVGKAWRKK